MLKVIVHNIMIICYAPRGLLQSNPDTFSARPVVGWLAPILATAVAYIVMRYGASLATNDSLRRAVMILFTLAFVIAAIAGIYGAFIAKAAPLM